MAVTIALVPSGARVKVKRGALPLDPRLVGLTGTVVGASEYHPTRVDVSLDGTGEIRAFSPMELQVLEPLELSEDRIRAGRRLARP